jgi:hypothetical protein
MHDDKILSVNRTDIERGTFTREEWIGKLADFNQQYVDFEESVIAEGSGEEGDHISSGDEEMGEEEGDMDILDSLIQFEGKFIAGLPPFVTDPRDPQVKYEVEVDMDSDNADSIVATRHTLDILYTLLNKVALMVPSEDTRVANHAQARMDQMVASINATIYAINDLQEAVGDTLELKESGYEDVSAAVMEALCSPQAPTELEELKELVYDLDEVVGGLNDDIEKNLYQVGSTSLEHMKLILERVGNLEQQGGVSGSSNPPPLPWHLPKPRQPQWVELSPLEWC